MKVTIDGFWWNSGPASLNHVTREIVLAWSAMFPEDQLTLACRWRERKISRAKLPQNITIKRLRIYPQALHALLGVPYVANRAKSDAVVTFNFAPITKRRSAVYIHDFLFLDYPEWFTTLENAYFRLMKVFANFADIKFTSSKYERNRIARHLGRTRIESVGLGMSTELMSLTPQMPGIARDLNAFVLTVGRLNKRKNLRVTLDACLASGEIGPHRPLIVVGETSRLPEGMEDFQNAIANRSIIFTGHISPEELVWLYKSCTLFIYLSLGEGFGMPPVEAAYFGAPILVSDIEPFHENLGNLATYVDPNDRYQVINSLISMLRVEASGGSRLHDRKTKQRVLDLHNWQKVVSRLRNELIDGA